MKKKILVWETLATISGGQKMTLTVMDMLKDEYDFICLIPEEGLLSAELKKRGIPYVLMGNQSLPTGVKGKQVIFRYGWMSVKNVCKSLKAIFNYHPDILYAPGPAALPWSAVCGSLTHKPVVWHLHHIFLDGATKKLLNLCGKWKSVKKIIAVSNCVGAQLRTEKAPDKVSVIYNPVDFAKYSSGKKEKITAELPQITDQKLVLGHVAQIQCLKKQDFTLNVTSELKRRGHDVLTLFAGECRDYEFQEELHRQIEREKLQENVLFLGRRNDIPDLLTEMDVLILPSYEGFPLAGLESASAGVPVAACDVLGAKELVDVSHAGEIFCEDQVSSAADAIEAIAANPKSYAEQGRKFAKSCTSEKYKEELRRLLGSI